MIKKFLGLGLTAASCLAGGTQYAMAAGKAIVVMEGEFYDDGASPIFTGRWDDYLTPYVVVGGFNLASGATFHAEFVINLGLADATGGAAPTRAIYENAIDSFRVEFSRISARWRDDGSYETFLDRWSYAPVLLPTDFNRLYVYNEYGGAFGMTVAKIGGVGFSMDFSPDKPYPWLSGTSQDAWIEGLSAVASASPAELGRAYVYFHDPIGYMSNDAGYLRFVSVNVAAVPEPETYAMFLAGLGLIGAAVRRRKTAA